MRSLFAAMRKGRKRKRGASLAMVLVSMTVLTIMGTLFTTIAMRSYQYSYSRLCRQQAYYTASSSVESFYNYVSSNPNVLSVMITQLNDACEGKVSADEGAQTPPGFRREPPPCGGSFLRSGPGRFPRPSSLLRAARPGSRAFRESRRLRRRVSPAP